VIAAALLLMGQSSANRTIEAKEFVLRDSNGKVRARLFMDDNNSPVFTTLRPDGTKGIVMYDYANGTATDSAISFLDRSGHIQVNLKANEIASTLRFNRPDGSDQVELAARTDAECALCTEPSPKGGVSLNLSSNTGVMMLDLFDKPSINIADLDGFRATVDLLYGTAGEKRKTSAASLLLFGKDGKVIWEAPTR
jgi:hypothetical protein